MLLVAHQLGHKATSSTTAPSSPPLKMLMGYGLGFLIAALTGLMR